MIDIQKLNPNCHSYSFEVGKLLEITITHVALPPLFFWCIGFSLSLSLFIIASSNCSFPLLFCLFVLAFSLTWLLLFFIFKKFYFGLWSFSLLSLTTCFQFYLIVKCWLQLLHTSSPALFSCCPSIQCIYSNVCLFVWMFVSY